MQAKPRTSPLTNNALLVARCDFPRRHAELIDVPIADDHLDRGCHFLIAVASLGVALPLESQALKLKLDCCIGIVSHNPSPSGPPTFAPNMAVGGRSLGTIWAVYLLTPNKRIASLDQAAERRARELVGHDRVEQNADEAALRLALRPRAVCSPAEFIPVTSRKFDKLMPARKIEKNLSVNR
jgi:hypothetical protein